MTDSNIQQEAGNAPAGYRPTARLRNRSRRQISYRSLALAAAFMLLVLMVAGPYMTFKPRPYTGEGSPLRQIFYIGIFVLLLFASRATSHPGRIFIIPASMTLALAWFWLSLVWAIEPNIAVRRLFLTTLIIMCTFMAVETGGYRGIVRSMRIFMILVLAVNYIAALGFPTLGTHTAQTIEGFGLDPGLIGDWRGVMGQKNFAGALCAFTLLAFIFDTRAVPGIVRGFMILASTYFLYRSGAKTSLGIIVLALACGGGFLLYSPRQRLLTFFLVAMGAVLGLGIALFNWEHITQVFARPDAFTGRVQIWSVLVGYWQDHWLGSGFGSFWNIGNDSPVYRYTKEGSWVALAAIGHSGYIDLLAQTGLPGLVLAVASTLVIPIVRLLSGLGVDRSRGALLLSFLVFCAGHNLTETSLFDRDSIVEVMLMFTLALIYHETRGARSEAAAIAPARTARRHG